LNYADGSHSSFNNNFKTGVYSIATQSPMTSTNYYNSVMSKLDKSSFIDYMILNNYAMNTDIWSYNIAFAKGGQASKPGNKWHYYLWNMPTIFNYSTVSNTNNKLPCEYSICSYSVNYQVSPLVGNGHGILLKYLMNTSSGVNAAANGAFQLEYKNRYQDLLNGPLQCKTILKHFDYVKELYLKEMKYHEDPASTPYPGKFSTATDLWDTNTVRLRKAIDCRCNVVANTFSKPGCYGLTGPFPLTVDVFPAGAGTVKLNSFVIDSYKWSGTYYETTLSFKAIPTNTTYVFDHWETKHTPLNSRPLSLDSIAIAYFKTDDVVAVFTDKSADLVATGENANVPTAFSPNGDGNNDVFKPLGSAKFTSEYEMTIWSRWGEEMFRSVSPNDGWDGNYKGQQAITGVYAYVISYKNIYGESKLLKGNVTLVR
jgi:gliding motility-associated-like protein